MKAVYLLYFWQEAITLSCSLAAEQRNLSFSKLSGILKQRLLCHAYKTHRLNTPNLIARAIRIPESN